MGLFKKLGESAQKAAAKAAEQAKVAGEKLKPVTEQLAAKGSEALEQASQTQIGQKVTRTASSVTTKVQHNVTAIAESDFGKSVGQKASQLGDSMSDAARWSTEQISQASVSVSSAIDAAQMRKDPQAQQKEDERIHSAEVAKESLQETTAQIVLQALGPSPVDLNYKICGKAKTLFPIPCEQQILWMDAEFDLRPSGIIVTNQGVFVKTDESIMPSGEDAEKSKLIYVKWDSFDPTWFIADSDENMAWKVNPECRTTFIETCRSLAPEEEPVETRLLEAEEQYGDMGLDATVRPATPSQHTNPIVNVAANTILSEEAVLAQNHAHVAGHGEMAEEAINKIDRMHGLDAVITGRDNAKNGADRVVNNMEIQTKYYKTAQGSIDAAFDPHNHMYRYMSSDGTPMQLEVPKDQYEAILHKFEKRIIDGKVPGVTDPKEAQNIVRKGRLTYQQAVNLTKPGTIESLAYDAATGIVVCTCAFGISFLSAAYSAYREKRDVNASIQAGVIAGAEVFGLTFIQHMLTNQLARTGLAHTLITPTQHLTANIIGYRGSATIVNGIRALTGKQAIHGAAASRHLAKIMRNNVITSAISFAVFSIPDTMRMADKKISTAQYAKNMVTLASSMLGAAAGSVGAGIAAAKVASVAGTAVTPGVGTVIGFAGGMVGGVVGSMAVKGAADLFYEDDAVRIGRFFNAMVSCLCSEYLLSGSEIDELIEDLNETSSDDMKNLIMDVVKSEQQEQTIRDFLQPRFEAITAKRAPFALPSAMQVDAALTEIVDIVTAD